MIRQLSDIEVAKYKAVAENASKSALDYASLHGYESWMHALQSAQEEARKSRENEIEAKKQLGYVIEELKRMTLYKERAELETKQVVAKYGGLSMTQLIFPSEMENMDANENTIEGDQKHKAEVESSSFFSSFRRKLKEKFNSFKETQMDDDQASDVEDTMAKSRSPLIKKQSYMPVSKTRSAAASSAASSIKTESSLLPKGQLTQSPTYSPPMLRAKSPTNSPPKLTTQSLMNSPQKQLPGHRNVVSDEPKQSNSSVNRAKGLPILTGYEATTNTTLANGFQRQMHVPKLHEQDPSEKIISSRASQVDNKKDKNSLVNDHRSKRDDTSEYSSRSTNRGESYSSRPSSAESGSIQSAREIQEGRLPAQYQNFRARQSNLTTIPKLSFSTPRQSDLAGMRYQMRRDFSVTDQLQCAWLQRASGPVVERYFHFNSAARYDVKIAHLTLRFLQNSS
jgi:hypothetical protein